MICSYRSAHGAGMQELKPDSLARNGLSDEEACTKVMAFVLLAKLRK